MKMKLWLTMLLAMTFSFTFAQKKGGPARTSAILSLTEYNGDNKFKDRLENAKKNIDIAINDAKTGDEPKTWRVKGQVYTALAKDNELSKKYSNAAIEAYDAYEKALSMEEAKAEVKGKPKSKISGKGDFISGFKDVASALYNNATTAYNAKEWERSYTHFERLTQIPSRTKEFDTKKKIKLKFTATTGSEIDMLVNARLLGGLAAIYSKKPEDAEKMFMPSIEAGSFKEEDVLFAYSKLASSYFANNNSKKAKEILTIARKKFPTDFDLLITEINIALSEGRLAELEEELSQAVKADPKNVELHFVMGNMYDELFRKKIDASNGPVSNESQKAGEEFLQKAVNWYKKAVELKADHFNSLYSLGAIHVNYSNFFAIKIQNSDKLSDAERKKLEADYDKYVDLGLVHLLEAEKVNGEDIGLIRALKEVYTRKSDDENWSKYNKKEKELLQKQ